MNNGYLDIIKDTRVNCYSVMRKMKAVDFLKYIEDAYRTKGGIEGQRAPLKTKTAISIRKRMVEDLKRGAVLPPVVLGILVDEQTMQKLNADSIELFHEVINNVQPERIAIIDGMQRTTGLIESIDEIDKETRVRIEYWISTSMDSLVYRMLVLNTGQIPWNLQKQLEVVFGQWVNVFSDQVPELELFKSDDPAYRKEAGQYQTHEFVELFILFGAKKIKVDIQDQLAEEFAKLDLIQASSNQEFINYFLGVADIMVRLDKEFSRLPKSDDLTKFKIGRDIFKSQPARVGFIIACSWAIFGKPGFDKNNEQQTRNYESVIEGCNKLIQKLNQMGIDELGNFIQLDEMDEITTKKRSGKVGEFEREFFSKAFETLLQYYDEIPNMSPCWRALL